MNKTDTSVQGLVIIVAAIVFLLLVVGFTQFCNEFSKELKYLNNEIRRTRGSERSYWLSRRRRLWLSLLPFVKY